MGYCPQTDAMFEYLTVRETLTLFARLKGVSDARRDAAVKTLLRTLLMEDNADKLYKELRCVRGCAHVRACASKCACRYLIWCVCVRVCACVRMSGSGNVWGGSRSTHVHFNFGKFFQKLKPRYLTWSWKMAGMPTL